MNAALEDLIRSTLSELAEEAPAVADQFSRAERRARLLRRTNLALGAAGTLAAVLFAAPIAIAATGPDGQSPATPSTSPTPQSTDQPPYPTAPPTPQSTDQPPYPSTSPTPQSTDQPPYPTASPTPSSLQ